MSQNARIGKHSLNGRTTEIMELYCTWEKIKYKKWAYETLFFLKKNLPLNGGLKNNCSICSRKGTNARKKYCNFYGRIYNIYTFCRSKVGKSNCVTEWIPWHEVIFIPNKARYLPVKRYIKSLNHLFVIANPLSYITQVVPWEQNKTNNWSEFKGKNATKRGYSRTKCK